MRRPILVPEEIRRAAADGFATVVGAARIKTTAPIQEEPMKGYFKSEAKFTLMWLLGVPPVVIVVGMIATFFILHRH